MSLGIKGTFQRRNSLLVDSGKHGGQQGSAGNDVLDQNVLVGGVGSGADGSHAVESGNAEGSGEVAVGAAAGGRLIQRETEIGRQLLCLFEESDDSGFALHGWAVDAAGERELAGLVEGLHTNAEEAVDFLCVRGRAMRTSIST